MRAANLAGRTVVAAFFIGCAWYGSTLAYQNYKFATLVSAAKILEKQPDTFSNQQMKNLVADASIVFDEKICRSDILRPTLTVYLAYASRQNQAKDYDAWAKAVDEADNFVKHMITCMPAEGNAWIREALLSRAIAENPQSLRDKVELAAGLSPNEQEQLRARVSLWARVSPQTLELAGQTVRLDVQTILQHGDRSLIRDLYSVNSIHSLVMQEIAGLDPELRASVERMLKP